MTNLDEACRAFKWAGGTIHQVAQELGMPGEGSRLVSMAPDEFYKLLKAHFDRKNAEARAHVLNRK